MSVKPNVIRSHLLHEFKFGTNTIEAHRKIYIAFGSDNKSYRKKVKNFHSDQESPEDEPRSGRPSVSKWNSTRKGDITCLVT